MGWLFIWLAATAFVGPEGLQAAEAAETNPTAIAITDPAQVFNLSTEQKTHSYPLHLEGRVSYFDPGFKILWLEQNHYGNYIHLAASPPALRTGQAVVIEGRLTPNKGLSTDEVTVRVIQEEAPVIPLMAKGRINDFDALFGRIVTVEGYVDGQQYIDPLHIRLNLIAENRRVVCWICPDDPQHVPNWQGCFVQATGLYSRKFDPSKSGSAIRMDWRLSTRSNPVPTSAGR